MSSSKAANFLLLEAMWLCFWVSGFSPAIDLVIWPQKQNLNSKSYTNHFAITMMHMPTLIKFNLPSNNQTKAKLRAHWVHKNKTRYVECSNSYPQRGIIFRAGARPFATSCIDEANIDFQDWSDRGLRSWLKCPREYTKVYKHDTTEERSGSPFDSQ